MALFKLQFRPGVNKETTDYTNEGGWFDSDKVRFRGDFPEKLGGWQKIFETSFLGSCRALHAWRALDDSEFVGVGTHLKYYIEQGGGFSDITPIRLTTDAGDVTFSATDGTAEIEVTHVDHGAAENDFVTYSDAVSLGGNITADVLNQEYNILQILDDDTYVIEAREPASISDITVDGELDPTPVLANASDSGDGGAGVVGAYQINTGLDTSATGSGWGIGPYSRGGWGSAADASLVTDKLRLWTHDNFGEDLLLNFRNGGVFYWDRSASSGVLQRAVELSSLPGASDVPVVAKQILVSDIDRHVIAFGANPLGSTEQDPLLIRFSSQETVTDWTPLPTNTAGDLFIGSGSEIVRAVETRQQILVFTDTSLHALQYIGPPFTFGVNKLSENVTIMGPNAAIAVDDRVFWMGKEEFYIYEGSVSKLPCTVKDFVFSRFNLAQREKVFASVNSAFSEVWWFYPSKDGDNNDSYVMYNYEQGAWAVGTLPRTAWIDRGTDDSPIAASRDGYLYFHEVGADDGSENPPAPIEAFITSSAIDIDDGFQFMFVDKVIPDITFRDSDAINPSALFTLQARNNPGAGLAKLESKQIAQTVALPVEQYTEQLFVRLRGRSIVVGVSSSDVGVKWRLGSPRISARTDGRRT